MSGTQPRPKSQEAEDALTAALRELAARVKIIRIDVAGINSPEGDTLKDLILLALDGAAIHRGIDRCDARRLGLRPDRIRALERDQNLLPGLT